MPEKRLQDLPIGIQTFEKLREQNYVYVDKTKDVYELARLTIPYFLSRPRRFGKSLLCSTFKALFEGKKHLFEGTWIASSDWQWQAHPVIHLDLSKISYESPEEFKKLLGEQLANIAISNGLALAIEQPGNMLSHLIKKLAAKGPLPVCLIDEYDYPIITHLDENTQLEAYREVMQNFYKPLKPCEEHLRFLFITGVSQFAKMSIFSALNHLRILSSLASAATICGYTQAELEHSFGPWITRAAKHNHIKQADLLAKIKQWYNGYSFADPQKAPHRVYNPFSIVNFFGDENAEFKDYWFASVTPTFVLQYFKHHKFEVADFEQVEATFSDLNSLKPEDIKIPTLLYQAGYMTIQSYDANAHVCTLQFPNYEIAMACAQQLITYATKEDSTELSKLAIKLRDLFVNNTISDKTLAIVLKDICAHIPSAVAPQQEKAREGVSASVLGCSPYFGAAGSC